MCRAVANRNDVFDLTVSLIKIDLAVSAKPMLKAGKVFEQFSIPSLTCVAATVSLPTRIRAGLILVRGKTRHGTRVPPYPFQDVFSSRSKISCRSISISAS